MDAWFLVSGSPGWQKLELPKNLIPSVAHMQAWLQSNLQAGVGAGGWARVGVRGTSARDGRGGLAPGGVDWAQLRLWNKTQKQSGSSPAAPRADSSKMTCCGRSGGNYPGTRDVWGQKPGRLEEEREELRTQWRHRSPATPTSRQTHLMWAASRQELPTHGLQLLGPNLWNKVSVHESTVMDINR